MERQTMNSSGSSHYFPMCLSNGTDSMMIDWTGSIASGTRSLKEVPLFWYKYDRRCAKRDNLYPIIRTGFCMYADGDEVYKGKTDQEFLHDKGIVQTHMRCEGFDIKLETFLTADHALVERFTILKTPKSKCAFEFFIMTPDAIPTFYLPVMYLPWSMIDSLAKAGPEKRLGIRSEFLKSKDKGVLECRYQLPVSNKTRTRSTLSGTILMCCDHKRANAQVNASVGRADTMGSLGSSRLWVDGIRAGDSFTRRTIIIDARDAAAHRAAAYKTARRPYASLRGAHLAEWEAYAARSKVNIPTGNLGRIYNAGLYNIRGNVTVESGMLTLGSMPWLWAAGA